MSRSLEPMALIASGRLPSSHKRSNPSTEGTAAGLRTPSAPHVERLARGCYRRRILRHERRFS